MVLNLKYPDPNEDLHRKPEPNACALKLPHCWAPQATEPESGGQEPLQFLGSEGKVGDSVQMTRK